MNYYVFPLFPRDHRDIPYWQTEDEHAVYAKDQKDVPEWLKAHHRWEPAFEVNKLPKLQLKVKMCCSKCAEKIVEEIREVRGVFDVRAERSEKKVVVMTMLGGVDEHEVLRKARKVHWKARFVELDAKEKQKPKGEKNPKDHGHGSDDDHDNRGGQGNQQQQQQGGGKQKGKSKALQTNPTQSVAGTIPWGQPFWPIQTNLPSYYYYPPGHVQRFPDPHGQYVRFI